LILYRIFYFLLFFHEIFRLSMLALEGPRVPLGQG